MKNMTEISILAFIFNWVRVYVYKSKHRAEHHQAVLGNLEKESLSDLSSNICMFVCTILATLLLRKVNFLSLSIVNEYPNYMFVYLLHLGMPNIFCILQSFFLYLRHKNLRKVVTREIKDIVSQRFYSLHVWSTWTKFYFVLFVIFKLFLLYFVQTIGIEC